ncbi:MAG: FAD-dependent oxidoreductase, partial [Pikeienuella sp.]
MTDAEDGTIAVVGGGFAGLSAAYELACAGLPVTVLEADRGVGGLATAVETAGPPLRPGRQQSVNHPPPVYAQE